MSCVKVAVAVLGSPSLYDSVDGLYGLFPHLHTPFAPFYPSVISLMVYVDVKHYVYFLTSVDVKQQ